MSALLPINSAAYVIVHAAAEHFKSMDFELYEASRAAGFPMRVYDVSLRDCIAKACGEKMKQWVVPLTAIAESDDPEVRSWIMRVIETGEG